MWKMSLLKGDQEKHMASKKTYWKNIAQLDPSDEAVKKLEQNEFVSKLPEDFLSDEKTLEESSTSRRDFLKYVGFSTAAATIAACEGPVIKSVPYVVQPEQIRPGVANYYATTIADGFDFGSILIKTREGRPIKVESNPDAPILGGANARVHASVLSLYDTLRLQGPQANGEDVSWDNFYLQTGAMLKALAVTGKEIILLMPTSHDHGKAEMSQHFQFESNMSLTGANADHRIPCTPADQKNILAYIYDRLIGGTPGKLSEELKSSAEKALSALQKSGAQGVLVSGIEDDNAQAAVLAINTHLKSQAFHPESPKLIRQGNSKEVLEAFRAIEAGTVSGLISVGVNPVFSSANGEILGEAIKNLEFSLNFSSKLDETSAASQFVAATPHYLESWGDYEFKPGHYALAQPTIRPLFDTQQFQDVLIRLTGQSSKFYDQIKAHWNESILGSESWSKALHDGYFSVETPQEVSEPDFAGINLEHLRGASSDGMSLVLYSKTGMGDGQQANNPWLQEFPDPITRVSWDNYLTVALKDAKALGLKNINTANGALNGSYATVTVGSQTLKVPVIIQPGQAVGTVGLSFGYGKRMGLKDEMQTGVNAYTLYQDFEKVQKVTVKLDAGEHEFACVQLHNTLMGRGDIVKETTLEIFNTKDKATWNPMPQVSKNHIEFDVTSPEVDMWQEFDRSIGHHFNLSIDLNSCTG